jgi:hypothetical protein
LYWRDERELGARVLAPRTARDFLPRGVRLGRSGFRRAPVIEERLIFCCLAGGRLKFQDGLKRFNFFNFFRERRITQVASHFGRRHRFRRPHQIEQGYPVDKSLRPPKLGRELNQGCDERILITLKALAVTLKTLKKDIFERSPFGGVKDIKRRGGRLWRQAIHHLSNLPNQNLPSQVENKKQNVHYSLIPLSDSLHCGMVGERSVSTPCEKSFLLSRANR